MRAARVCAEWPRVLHALPDFYLAATLAALPWVLLRAQAAAAPFTTDLERLMRGIESQLPESPKRS